MITNDYKAFLAARGASSISELGKKDLLAFAEAYMDDMSVRSIKRLAENFYGIDVDWKEAAFWVEKAFLSHKSLLCSPIRGECIASVTMASKSRIEYQLIDL